MLVFRASAFCGCLWFTVTQIIIPNVAAGSRVSDFMNFHDWSFYILTLFFFMVGMRSLPGARLVTWTMLTVLQGCHCRGV